MWKTDINGERLFMVRTTLATRTANGRQASKQTATNRSNESAFNRCLLKRESSVERKEADKMLHTCELATLNDLLISQTTQLGQFDLLNVQLSSAVCTVYCFTEYSRQTNRQRD